MDLIALVEELKRRTRAITAPLTVAVMGCIVNGPGEAREADLGLAAGKGHGVLFRGGRKMRKLPEADGGPPVRTARRFDVGSELRTRT